MKYLKYSGIIGLLLGVCIISLILPANIPVTDYKTDFARIEKAFVSEVNIVGKREEIVSLINKYKDGLTKISIAGKKYSGGGHTFSSGSIIIDMSEFNNIIGYDKENKTITVEAGITWGEIQDFIDKDNLAIGVMQSSNIFSVGGSLSSNIHGRDPRFGTIVDTVKSFRLITADGQIYNISKNENKELFTSVIGGFGLFGVITDVTLKLHTNETYIRTVKKVDYENYVDYLNENIIGNDNVGLHYGRLSISPGEQFLKDFHVTDYEVSNNIIKETLLSEKWILRNRFFFNLSRKFDWAKSLRWEMQKKFTDNIDSSIVINRNNAMRPPIKFISYYNKKDTDILHEYFIPLDKYNLFIDHLRKKLQENKVNLLSVTTRYISKDEQVVLNYNQAEMIGIVLYFNVGLSDVEQQKVKRYTQGLIDFAGELGGTYYLVYQNYASKKQIRNIYPRFDEFIDLKKKYDPQGLFSNRFYEIYK